MYTDENGNRKSPIIDFLLKLILVIVFVLLLVWLLPKNNNINLTPLTNQIFGENIDMMKEAATSYFTTERLPEKVNDEVKITLKEMLDKKLLIEFTDKNGIACDHDKSYVTITKLDDEYLMKVNLKCEEEEDYILVHMGCYDYCDNDICEAKTTVATKVETVPVPCTDCDKPIPPEPPIEKKYEYEYEKSYAKQYSAWSDWSAPISYVNTDNIQFGTTDTSIIEHYQTIRQVVGYKVSYNGDKPIWRDEYSALLGYATIKACADYDYYITTTSSTITTVSTIVEVTTSTTTTTYATPVGATWNYVGTESFNIRPSDTATTHYEYVGSDFSYCDDSECTSSPYSIYKVYKRIAGTVELTSNSNTDVDSTSTTSTTTVTDVDTGLKVVCTSVSTKQVPIYGLKKVFLGYEQTRTLLYGDVKYYRTKTRTLVKDAYTDIIWSQYDDTNLLNNGYSYTGNKKEIK